MFNLQGSLSTWGLYVLLMAALTAVTFGSLSELKFDTDDAEYLRDAAAVREDPTFLFTPNRHSSGRPTIEVIFLIGHCLCGDNPVPYHMLLVGLHLAASLLLIYAYRQLGADPELSHAGALLFRMNVAHFRAVH